MTDTVVETTPATADTGSKRVSHARCPECYPDPWPGDRVRRLCGLVAPIRQRPAGQHSGPPPNACVVCMDLPGCEVCGWVRGPGQ